MSYSQKILNDQTRGAMLLWDISSTFKPPMCVSASRVNLSRNSIIATYEGVSMERVWTILCENTQPSSPYSPAFTAYIQAANSPKIVKEWLDPRIQFTLLELSPYPESYR